MDKQMGVETPTSLESYSKFHRLPGAFHFFLTLVLEVLGISAAIIFGIWSVKSYEITKQTLSVALEANSIAQDGAAATATNAYAAQASSLLLTQLEIANQLELLSLCRGGLESAYPDSCSRLSSRAPFSDLVSSVLGDTPPTLPTQESSTAPAMTATSRGTTPSSSIPTSSSTDSPSPSTNRTLSSSDASLPTRLSTIISSPSSTSMSKVSSVHIIILSEVTSYNLSIPSASATLASAESNLFGFEENLDPVDPSLLQGSFTPPTQLSSSTVTSGLTASPTDPLASARPQNVDDSNNNRNHGLNNLNLTNDKNNLTSTYPTQSLFPAPGPLSKVSELNINTDNKLYSNDVVPPMFPANISTTQSLNHYGNVIRPFSTTRQVEDSATTVIVSRSQSTTTSMAHGLDEHFFFVIQSSPTPDSSTQDPTHSPIPDVVNPFSLRLYVDDIVRFQTLQSSGSGASLPTPSTAVVDSSTSDIQSTAFSPSSTDANRAFSIPTHDPKDYSHPEFTIATSSPRFSASSKQNTPHSDAPMKSLTYLVYQTYTNVGGSSFLVTGTVSFDAGSEPSAATFLSNDRGPFKGNADSTTMGESQIEQSVSRTNSDSGLVHGSSSFVTSTAVPIEPAPTRTGSTSAAPSAAPSKSVGSSALPFKDHSVSLGAIVGIVVVLVALLVFGAGALVWTRSRTVGGNTFLRR